MFEFQYAIELIQISIIPLFSPILLELGDQVVLRGGGCNNPVIRYSHIYVFYLYLYICSYAQLLSRV